jgi:hypothetical protein
MNRLSHGGSLPAADGPASKFRLTSAPVRTTKAAAPAT